MKYLMAVGASVGSCLIASADAQGPGTTRPSDRSGPWPRRARPAPGTSRTAVLGTSKPAPANPESPVPKPPAQRAAVPGGFSSPEAAPDPSAGRRRPTVHAGRGAEPGAAHIRLPARSALRRPRAPEAPSPKLPPRVAAFAIRITEGAATQSEPGATTHEALPEPRARSCRDVVRADVGCPACQRPLIDHRSWLIALCRVLLVPSASGRTGHGRTECGPGA